MKDNKDPKKRMYSMETENVKVLLEEANMQLGMTREFMIHYLVDAEFFNQNLMCTLSEYYVCNFVLAKELEKCLEYSPAVERDGRKELILTDQNLTIIEQSAMARYVLTKQMAELNLSTYLN